jgi:hypothetical protein
MGNCVIEIHVTGAHHNGVDYDIDQMAAKFVEQLRAKHNVTAAYIVSGGEHNLLDTAARFPVQVRRGELASNGVPRRCRVDLSTPAETAIRAAIEAVERAGAHPFLTDAVTLLGDAKDKVADFVELTPVKG